MNCKVSLCMIFLSLLLNACGGSKETVTLYQKGNELFAKREFKKAMEHYERALDRDDSMSNAHLMIAKIHYYEKRFPAALESL